jgi:chromosome segregation ATPase
MHDTDKILQKLAELSDDLKSLQGNVTHLQDGQTLLQADVKGLQNGQHSLQGAVKGVQEAQKSFQETEDRRGKLLTGIADIASTILQEQHAQRTDIRSLHDQGRSLHDELHATKEELKSVILAARAEAKRDTMDLKAAVVRKLKSHEQRIDELEDAAGIPHPDEN